MTSPVRPLLLALAIASTAACADPASRSGDAPDAAVAAADAPDTAPATTGGAAMVAPDTHAFVSTAFHTFASPWAMTFLPDGRLLLTEKAGTLRLFDPATKTTGEITGVPEVVNRGQGGFGDVVLHPQHATNSILYLS